jgi:hypothetical protein
MIFQLGCGICIIAISVNKFIQLAEKKKIENNYKKKKHQIQKMNYKITKEDVDLILEGWD